MHRLSQLRRTVMWSLQPSKKVYLFSPSNPPLRFNLPRLFLLYLLTVGILTSCAPSNPKNIEPGTTRDSQ